MHLGTMYDCTVDETPLQDITPVIIGTSVQEVIIETPANELFCEYNDSSLGQLKENSNTLLEPTIFTDAIIIEFEQDTLQTCNSGGTTDCLSTEINENRDAKKNVENEDSETAEADDPDWESDPVNESMDVEEEKNNDDPDWEKDPLNESMDVEEEKSAEPHKNNHHQDWEPDPANESMDVEEEKSAEPHKNTDDSGWELQELKKVTDKEVHSYYDNLPYLSKKPETKDEVAIKNKETSINIKKSQNLNKDQIKTTAIKKQPKKKKCSKK